MEIAVHFLDADQINFKILIIFKLVLNFWTLLANDLIIVGMR